MRKIVSAGMAGFPERLGVAVAELPPFHDFEKEAEAPRVLCGALGDLG
jgi:hypothetical protein